MIIHFRLADAGPVVEARRLFYSAADGRRSAPASDVVSLHFLLPSDG